MLALFAKVVVILRDVNFAEEVCGWGEPEILYPCLFTVRFLVMDAPLRSIL